MILHPWSSPAAKQFFRSMFDGVTVRQIIGEDGDRSEKGIAIAARQFSYDRLVEPLEAGAHADAIASLLALVDWTEQARELWQREHEGP